MGNIGRCQGSELRRLGDALRCSFGQVLAQGIGLVPVETTEEVIPVLTSRDWNWTR